MLDFTFTLSHETTALLLFASMGLLMLTGQRVFAAIGFVGAVAAAFLWGTGGSQMAFNASITLMKWFPMISLPLFIYMGYVLSESGIANDLYRMFHVWVGPLPAVWPGTVGLMVAVSAMNGLSVAGLPSGPASPCRRCSNCGYDKRMVTGIIQAGSSIGLMMPPSVVLVLYGMIARQPVSTLWIAGIGPALLLAAMLTLYIVIRCKLNPALAPALSKEELASISPEERRRLLRAGLLPLVIIVAVTGSFLTGMASLVESSAVGALVATLAAYFKKRLTRKVMNVALVQTLSVSCMFMWIIMGALCFSSVFDGLGAVHAIKTLFLDAGT